MSYIYKVPKPTSIHQPTPYSQYSPIHQFRYNHEIKNDRVGLGKTRQSSFDRLPKLINQGYNTIGPIIDRLMQDSLQQNKIMKASLQQLNINQKQVLSEVKRKHIQKKDFQIYEYKNRNHRQKQGIHKHRVKFNTDDSIDKVSVNPFDNYKSNDHHYQKDYQQISRHNSIPHIHTNRKTISKSKSNNKFQKYWNPNNLEPIFEQTERGKQKEQQLREKVQLLLHQKQQLIQAIHDQVESNKVLSNKISSLKNLSSNSSNNYDRYQDQSRLNLEQRVEYLATKLKRIEQQNNKYKSILMDLQNKKTLYRNKSHQNFQFGFSSSHNNIQRRQFSKNKINSNQSIPEGILKRHTKQSSQGSKQRLPSIQDFDRPFHELSKNYIECIPRNVESKYYRPGIDNQSFVSDY